MPCSIQSSSKLVEYNTFLDPTLASDDHSFSLVLNGTNVKMADCKKEQKDAMNENEFLLNIFRSLEIKHRPLSTARDGLKSVMLD